MALKSMQPSTQSPVSIMAILVASVLLHACASTARQPPVELPTLRDRDIPAVEFADLGAVSEEMEAYLDRYIPRSAHAGKRAWTLAYVATDNLMFPFNYDPEVTLPPAQTFRLRTGNCLSFSMMLVAMARHIGVPARFEEGLVEPDYRNIDDTYVNSRHVIVVLGKGQNSVTVDVSRKVLKDDIRTRRVSDRNVAAQFYNNLGVNALLTRDLGLAWARFRQALEIDPGLAFVWSNLGVVYNRNDQPAEAEWSYQTALEVDDSESIAFNNLYVIYLQEGREGEAAGLESRVERHRQRNPYYLALLADEALRSQQYKDAIRLLRRSIKIQGDEYRFHGALAQAQYLSGNHEDALSSLDMARSLAPPGETLELDSLASMDFSN